MVLSHAWKKRSLYGNQVFKKIRKFSILLDKELKEDKPDIEKLGQLARMYGYLTQVQLSNISKVEEFDMMEIMDRYNEHQEGVQEISQGKPEEGSIITR